MAKHIVFSAVSVILFFEALASVGMLLLVLTGLGAVLAATGWHVFQAPRAGS